MVERKPRSNGSEHKTLRFYLKVAREFYKRRRFGIISDPFYDLVLKRTKESQRVKANAEALPSRKVLLAAVDVPSRREGLRHAVAALSKTKHDVTFVHAPMGDRGKFDNISLAISNVSMEDYDWFIVFDDDIELPENFLDEFIYLSEKAGLALSQPAHRINSHRIWDVTRRTWRNLVRRTRFVECGPVTAFHRSMTSKVVPFPPSRYGWGLDILWSELAEEHGLPIGIVDATPIRHVRPVAKSYDWYAAEREMGALLATHGIVCDFGNYMRTTVSYRTFPQNS